MFNRTTSTKFFAPRRQDRKELNLNFEYRNPKQCQNSNYQNFKLFNSLVLEIGIMPFGFVSNFGFRASSFLFSLSWRPLPRGISLRPRSCCSPEALFHRGESAFSRFPKAKFNGKIHICLVRLISHRALREVGG